LNTTYIPDDIAHVSVVQDDFNVNKFAFWNDWITFWVTAYVSCVSEWGVFECVVEMLAHVDP
jgi:hypothetical protein